MASSNEGKAHRKEQRKFARLDILISKEKGYLEVTASLAASSHSSEAYREPLRAVEIEHSLCKKRVSFSMEQKEDCAYSVLSCDCCLRLEFPPGTPVTTVGELDRELKRQDKDR